MRLRRRSLLAPVALSSLLASACSDGPSEPKRDQGGEGESGLRLIAGAGVQDTVTARRSQALVVEVRDEDGALRSGVVVRFESGPPSDSTRRWERGMFVCAVSASDCLGDYGGASYFVADSTDGRGRAVAQVRHGTIAGPTWIVVTVPEFGLRDSFPYTTLPGAAARVVAAPRDTALNVGASYTLGGGVQDRFGNRRAADVVTYTAGPRVQVTTAGRVTGAQIGRGHVLLAAGARVDTAFVSVVPQGRLAAAGNGQLVIADFDGSNRRNVSMAVSWDAGLRPTWLPGTSNLVVNAGSDAPRLRLVNGETGTSTALAVTGTAFAAEYFPDATAGNGGWIYFTGMTTGGSYQLWRTRHDGSGAVRPTTTPAYIGYYRPAVSPDGSRFAALVIGESEMGVRVFDAATGAALSPVVPGLHSPRWSPDGQWVAMGRQGGGPMHVMRADGTQLRAVSSRSYGEWVDWSADGQWLVGTSMATQSLELVRVSDGEWVPIAWGLGLWQPAVKR